MAAKKFTPMKQWTDNLARTLSTTLPERLGATAEKFYRNSFRNQGFTDRQLVKWRKLKNPRTNSRGKVLKQAILRGTGNLANSIRVERADFRGVVIAAGNQQVPYARIHNELDQLGPKERIESRSQRTWLQVIEPACWIS